MQGAVAAKENTNAKEVGFCGKLKAAIAEYVREIKPKSTATI